MKQGIFSASITNIIHKGLMCENVQVDSSYDLRHIAERPIKFRKLYEKYLHGDK